MSPQHVPATVTELSRIGLLAELPGELLMKVAGRMAREEVGAGQPVVREGDAGDRFYVVLSGMLTVSQEVGAARRMLRPGDTFGELAVATGAQRTASVRAVTPAVVASCDRETFDEFLRPLFERG